MRHENHANAMRPDNLSTVDTQSLLTNTDFFQILDLIGVIVMGISGGAIAARMNFDAVGFAVVGIMSGLGGGIIRDVILDSGPPASFQDPIYFICALAGSAFSYIVATDGKAWRGIITVLDTAAMALWAATGTVKSLAMGLEPLPSLLLGVVSAVGGGATRDVTVGRIPQIFGGGPLYASCALLTAIGTWGVYSWNVDVLWTIVPIALGMGLALLAAWRRWQLPQHRNWQVTLSDGQLQSLLRRVRRRERERVARESGLIPAITMDDLKNYTPREEAEELIQLLEEEIHDEGRGRGGRTFTPEAGSSAS